MKKVLIILLVLSMAIVAYATFTGAGVRFVRSMHPQVNTVGLVFHYKMWDGYMTASEVFDYSLNENQGTSAGTVTPEYPGFDFTNGEISSGSGTLIDDVFDGGGTLSVWLSPESQGPTNDGRVADKSRNGNEGWRLFCPGSDTTLEFHMVTDGVDGQWTFPIDILGDIWQHVVITYNADATANNPIVYINGLSVTVTETGTPNNTRTSDAGNDLYLGSEASGGNYYDGSMDDFMLFSRVLSAVEARNIYEVTRWRYSK